MERISINFPKYLGYIIIGNGIASYSAFYHNGNIISSLFSSLCILIGSALLAIEYNPKGD